MRMTSETEQRNYEAFFNAYVEAALWSSTDEADEPLDKNYSRENLAPETLEQMERDCWSFLTGEPKDITQVFLETMPSRMYERAGYHLWLSRNGHGVNFELSGGWDFTATGGEDMGALLDKRADAYGTFDLYVADGLIYGG